MNKAFGVAILAAVLSLAVPARGQDQAQARPGYQGRSSYGWYDPGVRDPFAEFEEIQRMMDRLFADTYRMDYGRGGAFVAEPSLDVRETESEIVVTCDLPGMDKDKIEVSLQDGVLTISGERQRVEEVTDAASNYHRAERVFGSFCRSVTLPAAVDEKEITAEYKNGVLAVVLKKLEPSKPAGVKIQVL